MPALQKDLQFHHKQLLPVVKWLFRPKSNIFAVPCAITDPKLPEAHLVLSILFRGGLPDAEMLLDLL